MPQPRRAVRLGLAAAVTLLLGTGAACSPDQTPSVDPATTPTATAEPGSSTPASAPDATRQTSPSSP